MELTCPQLKSCTFGTKRIWEEARHFCFNRCTNAQREAFYQVNEEWATVAKPLLAFLWRLYHPQDWGAEQGSQSFAWLLTRYFDADSRNYSVGGTNPPLTRRTLRSIYQNCE